jgi:hypothetical protein
MRQKIKKTNEILCQNKIKMSKKIMDFALIYDDEEKTYSAAMEYINITNTVRPNASQDYIIFY